MNATKNIYTISYAKKKDYSTFYFVVIFLVAAASLGGGGYWFCNYWEKREALKEFEKAKNLVFDVQKIEPSEKENKSKTPYYERTHSQVRGNHRRAKKLTTKIQENPQYAKWEPVLENIKRGLNKEEDLKVLKDLKDNEEDENKQILEEFFLQTYRQGKSLERLSSHIIGVGEIQKQIEAQENWLLKAEEDKNKAIEPIGNLIKHFYQLFLSQLEDSEKTPWWLEVEIIEDKPVKNTTFQQKWANYNYLKSLSPNLGMEVQELNWMGFSGFLDDNHDKGKEGSNTLGLTISTKNDIYNHVIGKNKFVIARMNNLEIKLKKELLFNRYNKYYDEWVSDLNLNNGTWTWTTLDISEENLINTIAHELAHAVIDNTHLNYKPEDGGHGPLHDEYTERIEKLIIEDKPRYEQFMAWWREPRNVNDQN